jgi:DNA modification methylase
MKLSGIKQNPTNPRIIKDDKFQKLVTSIKEFPEMLEARPIVVNPDMIVLGGNMRLKAAKAAGLTEAPVYVATWEEAKAKEFIVKDNVGFGEWDWDILANEWDATELDEWGLDVWQPEEEEEVSGLTDPDEVPEAPEEPKTKLGDLYILGEHRVMCGDSTKAEDVEKLMNGEKAELLFTSPPYSDMREYNGGKDLRIDNLINFIPTFSNYANYQVINLGIQRKDNEIIEYWGDYISKAKETGYKLLSWNVWDRSGSGHSIGNQTAMFPIWHEWIFVFGTERGDLNKTKINKSAGSKAGSNRQKNGTSTKGKGITANFGKIGTVIKTGTAGGKLHPAMFPVELPEEYIKSMTNQRAIISEPFLGSGTTLIAAEKTRRKCYGMELDPKYCDVIVKRWEDFTGKKAELWKP